MGKGGGGGVFKLVIRLLLIGEDIRENRTMGQFQGQGEKGKEEGK